MGLWFLLRNYADPPEWVQDLGLKIWGLGANLKTPRQQGSLVAAASRMP